MKKKNLNIKLQLNKETIASLNNDQMKEINGGFSVDTGCGGKCVLTFVRTNCVTGCVICPISTQCPTNTCPATWNC